MAKGAFILFAYTIYVISRNLIVLHRDLKTSTIFELNIKMIRLALFSSKRDSIFRNLLSVVCRNLSQKSSTKLFVSYVHYLEATAVSVFISHLERYAFHYVCITCLYYIIRATYATSIQFGFFQIDSAQRNASGDFESE